MPAKGARTMTLLASGLPGFRPAFVADASAQSQHGMDMAAFPPHPAAFQAGLNHQLVGTLHHAGPAGPACLSEERIRHQGQPFAHITPVLTHLFPVDFVLRQVEHLRHLRRAQSAAFEQEFQHRFHQETESPRN